LQLKEELAAVENPADNIIAFIDAYIDGLENGGDANLTFLNTVREMIEGIEAGTTNIQMPLEVYRSQLNTAEEQTKAWQNTTVSAFKGAEDALTDFVMKGKADFKSFIDSIIADLIRLAIRQQIIAPLFNFFNPAAATPEADFNVFGTKPVATFNNGGFTGFGSRSGGLDGKGGFPAILHPNETVIDHTKGGGAGAIVINQSVNFATGVQDTVKNEVLQLLPDIAETSKAAVVEAMNRGGNFRRGMR
jgi:phage-related minor tail protein